MNKSFCCPFDEQSFDTRRELEIHMDKVHVSYLKDPDTKSSAPSFDSYPSSSEDCIGIPSWQSSRDLDVILTSIKIPENPLSEIGKLSEERILRIAKTSFLSDLRELNLSKRGLSVFGSNDRFDISKLTNLENLDLSENYLTSLKGIGECKNLVYLNVSKNSVTDVEPLSNLQKLRVFKASKNKIKDISPLAECKRLTELNLNGNSLLVFSLVIRTLKKLHRLSKLSIMNNPCMIKIKDSRTQILTNLWLEELDRTDVKIESKTLIRKKLKLKKKQGKLWEIRTTHTGPIIFCEKYSQEQQLKALRDENSKLREELNKIKTLILDLARKENEKAADEVALVAEIDGK
ncbi:unnamed protein product [Blepharisma stoltei]|uniref:C2H2-type domain-containing protein n=1 Tax=Blepharisma stoltei TaxID=1481888 RepID=A0AAU9K0F1_9CILI|nr:unnamed protein product [Blepharisma stoltei]